MRLDQGRRKEGPVTSKTTPNNTVRKRSESLAWRATPSWLPMIPPDPRAMPIPQ